MKPRVEKLTWGQESSVHELVGQKKPRYNELRMGALARFPKAVATLLLGSPQGNGEGSSLWAGSPFCGEVWEHSSFQWVVEYGITKAEKQRPYPGGCYLQRTEEGDSLPWSKSVNYSQLPDTSLFAAK